jgi:hypothetical protein
MRSYAEYEQQQGVSAPSLCDPTHCPPTCKKSAKLNDLVEGLMLSAKGKLSQ